MANKVRDLYPTEVWNHFEDLNAVPRPSKKEERVITFIENFAKKYNLESYTDEVGNVIVKKNATKGMEDRKTVVLQSHLDMVHQKNANTVFDFETQGIKSYIDGDWVKAKGTTLGADNGMGVAAIMTILSSDDIEHPNIEALFTIDEEAGMTGAKNLKPNLLKGEILLNLDTEDDDEFSIGCAGGIDTTTFYNYDTEEVKQKLIPISLYIKGLKGGHSGMDINLGRGNANKLLVRILFELNTKFYLSEIDGGGLRNAIPREATANLFITSQNDFENEFTKIVNKIKVEYKTTEPSLEIFFETENEVNTVKVLKNIEQNKIINAIYSCTDGVYRMSADIVGLVETSSNLACVLVKDGKFETKSLQRSSVDSAKYDIANQIKASFELMECEVKQSGEYPGWTPNIDAQILKVMKQIYIEKYNENPRVKACHAGLECGILGVNYPNMEMISFGPNIKNPHSPDEKVNIKSVGKFYDFLKEILKQIP